MSRYTNQMLASQPIGAPGAGGALGDSYRGGNGGEGYNAHTGDANGYYEAEPVDYDIYNRAIAVSSPREIGVEGDTNPGVVKKKVVRRVEVPFTRQVKVPTQTMQIVPTMIETKVPVKKLVEVPGYKTVDEQYTEYEEREAIREKEVWVKKIVPERYIERVPITRVRQVQKPTTIVKEVESYEVVAVPGTKRVNVPGYRIDEVQDSKVVEVEEEQAYGYHSYPVGDPQLTGTRDLGRIPNGHLSRTMGQSVFHPNHPALRDVDHDANLDSTVPLNTATTTQRGASYPAGAYAPGSTIPAANNPNAFSPTQRAGAPNNASMYRPSSPTSRNLNIQASNATSGASSQYGQPRLAASNGAPSAYGRGPAPVAGAYRKETDASNLGNYNPLLIHLGVGVDESHTRHTDGSGVILTRVDRGSVAAKSGLQPFDIVTSVNGRPSTTCSEFIDLVGRYPTPVQITINRDGRRNIALTLFK